MTTEQTERCKRALQAFDAANSQDPTLESWQDQTQPAALLYGWRMSDRLRQFVPNASEALQLAARAQHIERWRIPRTTYPMTRQGYHQWRRRLAEFHAERAGGILQSLDYPQPTIDRVQSLLLRLNRSSDPECQTLEDVVCQVFIEYYLADFAATKSEDKLLDILRKTWAKMSPAGQQAALQLDLPAALQSVLGKALAGAI